MVIWVCDEARVRLREGGYLGLLKNRFTPHDSLKSIEFGCDEHVCVEQVHPPIHTYIHQ